jgi:serine/threonine protein kinase
MEYSSIGTLKALQSSVEPLPFRVKQTLCYDVGRGLSALHAARIVHGDLKHENVLVFANRSDVTGVEYIAKLADFGGSVMDMTSEEFRRMESWTWPFQAPEWEDRLAHEGMKLTDVYSFGLLVWRTFLDSEGFVSLPGAAPSDSYEAKRSLTAQKATDEFTSVAIADIRSYSQAHGIPQRCSELITYVVLHTVRLNPLQRSLVKAQAALRGIKLGSIKTYIEIIQQKNAEKQATDHSEPPGRHGITPDGLSFMLGRYGESIDLQDNLPGYRPHLEEPDNGEFLFEPEEFKTILTWEQQEQIVAELKDAVSLSANQSVQLLDMKKSNANFYLFQCYLQEFGVEFDPQQVVTWLSDAASEDDSHEDTDYLAQAWLWRISRALGVYFPISTERLIALLRLSVIRGHRTALQDLWDLASSDTGDEATNWRNTYWRFRGLLLSDMAAVGVGYFYAPHMTKTFDLGNIAHLDEQIRNELRNDFVACLKQADSTVAPQANVISSPEKTPFDRIYLNIRGHGLLHYAAATGHLAALRHMITTYRCDINLPNQHVDETPLICACAGGKLDCALFLIQQGADPNGWRYSQEGPLHWLCSFLPNEMETIASQLIAAGADIELRSRGMRHDVRSIRSDWEHIFEIGVTPLGRAVLMNNIDAVRVLLKLGANPLTQMANKHRGEWEGLDNSSKVVEVQSPFELAAVLTLPEILAEFINHVDGRVANTAHRLKLLDEASMLEKAHGLAITKFDPLALQSRLVRCGTNYKSHMRMTLAILYTRALSWNSYVSDDLKAKRSRILCYEIKLGNIDIVECLLQLGYDANGTKEFVLWSKPLKRTTINYFRC